MSPSVVCGPFEVIELIAEGGMGEIWRGRHLETGLRVAIKFVSRLAGAEQSWRSMFRAEVRAHAGLEHPGIIRVLDYGEVDRNAAQASGGEIEVDSPFLVTEFAAGGTLREIVPLDNWSTLQSLLLHILDALAFAHARGVVHRDLKPENILLAHTPDGGRELPPGVVKLADFGIAHAVGRASADKTLPSDQDAHHYAAQAGTPRYMAPEQWRGQWRRFGPWTDLYQLGAMTWELVCGRPPFDTTVISRLGISHVTKPLPALEPRFAVPDKLDAWIAHLTAKKPAERYQCAADAAWNLKQLEAPTPRPEATSTAAPQLADTIAPGESSASAGAFTTLPFLNTFENHGANLAGDAVSTHPNLVAPNDETLAEVPPLPTSWHAPAKQAPPSLLVGAGLGLFGLRDVPFVDRQAQRDALWDGLSAVVREHAGRGVLVEGPSGVGKSRLARWLVRRAQEIGACEALCAFHNPNGGATTGLVSMVEDFMGTWDLARDEVYQMVSERVRAIAPKGEPPRRLERDARALTEFLRPTADDAETVTGPRHRFGSKAEQHAVLQRLIGYAAHRRPLVIWLDDIQWGRDAIEWYEFVFEHLESTPVLFVLTARIDGLAPAARANLEHVRDVRGRLGHELLSVQPLASQDHAELVTRLLSLEPELAGVVAARTEGNPLFAVQLVGDWVARDELEATPEGFRLRADCEEPVPDAIRQLWARRIEHLIGSLPAAQRADARAGLELAAALGREVDEGEWHRACQVAGLAVVDRLVERLDEVGLAETRPGRWRFVHVLLVETLQETSRRAGRWGDLNIACAQMLDGQRAHRPVEREARRAEHLVQAGRLEEAISTLSVAVSAAIRRMDLDKAESLNRRQLRLIDDLGLPGNASARLQNQLHRAELLSSQDMSSAGNVLEQIAPMIEAEGKPDNLLRLLLARAKIALQCAQLDQAQQFFRRAEHIAPDASIELRARLARGRGHAARFTGEYEAATRLFETCRDLYAQAHLPAPTLQVESDICYLASERGHHEEARRRALELLEEARELGDVHAEAQFLNVLGEATLQLEDWEASLEYYAGAIEADRQIANHAGIYVQHLNRSTAAYASGKYELAREHVETAAAGFQERGVSRLMPFVLSGRLAYLGGLGQWQQWDDTMRELHESLAANKLRTTHHTWAMRKVAEICERAGEDERRRQALLVVRSLWEDMGEQDKASAIDRLLA